MTTLTPSLDGQHRANVAARWREIDAGKIIRVIDLVNERALPVKARHQERLNRILNADIKLDAKIYALWEAVDEIGALAAPHSACRRGCSHCCHVPVLVPEQEAALIGKRIGVKPAKVKGVKRGDESLARYDNPCPFLKGGACSIYASRPLACRQQFNMDSDALLCELVEDGAPPKVPYLNMFDYTTVLAMMTARRESRIERDPLTGLPVVEERYTPPNVGDIRDFFPNGKR
ncbi:YkgJ family cysteine cluster protein [Paraburkholderia sp. EG304]|uniref:YkgJ family cysteine cluster protein n=1 Tax=Paraburkholderia sp. EG304 TaxID=3237015 RepID=UPI00397D2A50